MRDPGCSWLRALFFLLLTLPLVGCAIKIDPFATETGRTEKDGAKEEDKDAVVVAKNTNSTTGGGGGGEPVVEGTGSISQLGFLLLLVTGVTAFFALLLGTRAIKRKRRPTTRKMVVVPADPVRTKPETGPGIRAG